MKNYALPLLLHLSLNTLVAADVPTFTQRDGNAYIGDVTDNRGLEPNDILAEDDGDLRITLGPELSQTVVKIAKENCNDPESDECKKRMAEALGIGPSANGLQKRVIQLIPVLGVLAFSYITYKILTYKGELWGNTEGFKVVDIKLPKEQKEEVSNWDISEENKFMYKPQEGDSVEVLIDDDQPKPEHPITFSKNDEGDVTINLPGLVPTITEAYSVGGCGRTGLKRSLNKRVTMLDIMRCAAAIDRIGQIGGMGGAIQYVDPYDFLSKPDTELFVESEKDNLEYVRKMNYGQHVDDVQREKIARFTTWVAMATEVGEITFTGDKLVLRKAFIISPDKKQEGGCDPNKKPDADSPTCDDPECDGKDRICTKGENKGCRCTDWTYEVIEAYYDKEFGDEQQKVLKEALANLPDSAPPKCFENTNGDGFDGKPIAVPSAWCVCTSGTSSGIYATMTQTSSPCAYDEMPTKPISISNSPKPTGPVTSCKWTTNTHVTTTELAYCTCNDNAMHGAPVETTKVEDGKTITTCIPPDAPTPTSEPEPTPTPERNCPKPYPGWQGINEIPQWIEDNQCKDVCPGEKWDFCPIDSSSPPDTGLCQCTDKKCTDAGTYACWVKA